MAVADSEIAVLECDKLPGNPILADGNHFTRQHRIYLGISGVQVDTVMELPFPGKRVFAITVWRIDLDMRERIAYA